MTRSAQHNYRGFTIIELLLASSLTVILLFMIDRLFFDTVNAVSQGAALSQTIAGSRTVSDQLQRDVRNMIGPSEGGFLFIVNNLIPNATVKTPNGTTTRDVRADQLIFIRDAEGLEPMAPGQTNSFNNGAKGDYARVFYGHCLRTNPDGTGPTPAGLANSIATDWILGRQALVLAGTTGASSIYVDGATFDSEILGSGSPTLVASPPAANPRPMYMGLSDVSDRTLDDLTGPGGLFDGPVPGAGLAVGSYISNARLITFMEERLRVNPQPAGTTFESWRIGQMHALLQNHVSDFVVEFAADVKVGPDGEIDLHGGTNNLVWYGMGNEPTTADWTHINFPNPPSPATFGKPDPYLEISANEKYWIFRHDYKNNWPYLIRVRYRLHDANGRLDQWFEQIFAVNRD